MDTSLGMGTGSASDNNDRTAAVKEQIQDALQKGRLQELPFTVNSNAKNYKVRIMNIKSRYKQGIKLPIGNYDVEVSASGYVQKRLWVSHKQNKATHTINLSPAI